MCWKEEVQLRNAYNKDFMCEHNKKAKMFCVSQGCSHTMPFGCIDCIRKYHKPGLKETLITEDDLLALLKIYQVPSHLKEERKAPIYRLFQMLTTCKNQLSDQLDLYFGSILNKLKYPFLYHQNILDAYRTIRDKNYHRINQADLLSFYKTSKKTTNQSFVARQIQFYQQYVKQTHESMTEISHKLEQFEKILQFKVSEKTYALHHEVSNEFTNLTRQFFPMEVVSTPAWPKSQKRQELRQQKQKANDLKTSSILKPKNSNQEDLFLTPKKSEGAIDILMEKSPSILASEHKSISKMSEGAGNMRKLDSRTSLFDNVYQKSIKLLDKNTKKGERQRSYSQIQSGGPKSQRMQFAQGYACDAENIFIKISQAPVAISMESSGESVNHEKNKNCSTNSTIKQTARFEIKEAIKAKQQNVIKRLSDLMKQRNQNEDQSNSRQKTQQSILNDSKIEDTNDLKDLISSSSKNRGDLRQSHFLTVNNRRKASESDSLAKEIFAVSRDDKPKIISRSIKKEIPLVEGPIVKTQPIPIKVQQPTTNEKELEMAAIFLSGINQPSIENKVCFLQKYIAKYQSNLTAVEYLSFLYLQQGKPKECHQLCSSYIERVSNCRDDKAINNLAINYCASLNQLGRYSEAIKFMEERLRHCDNDHIHKIIADSFFSIGVMDKAVYHYERATKMNPRFDEAYYNLAVILYMQDSFFNAKMNIEKALKLNNNSNYLELRQHIEERIQMSSQQ